MTSLAHQLKRLALPQNDSNLFSRREVASVLFEPKDAASMDRSTFFALGCTGLEEMMGIDQVFSEFQETLFSQASLALERSVQTKEVNKKLDKNISVFLTRLSPYFLLKPALKCIEWLIHRFHIHLYNQDSLIACVLPYHETKLFVRVIQLLKIEDPTHKWHWLHGLQKPGVPLARGTLLIHCYKDLGFMDFICSMVTKSVKAYSGFFHDGNCPQLRVIFSFYASTIVASLEAVEKITDPIIAKLLPHIQLGLKSELSDYKAASYMIVCQMAVKVVMEDHLVNTLTVQLCRSLGQTQQLMKDGLSSIIILLQNQKEGIVGPKLFGYLSAVPTLVSTLQSISTVHDITPLMRYLLPYLIHSVMNQDDEQQNEDSSSSVDHHSLLDSIFQNLQLNSPLENTTARHLLEEYVISSREMSSDEISALNQRILSTVRLFESRYPSAMDVVLESHVKNVLSDQDKNLLHQFISLTMSCGKYQIMAESDTSLMLSLNHPSPSVRNMALNYLNEIFTSKHSGFDEVFLKEVLLERIKDDVPDVVMSAITAIELHLDSMDPEEMVSSLGALLHRIKPSADWCSVFIKAVEVLDDPRVVEGNPELKDLIIWEFLPFLVVTRAEPKCVDLQMASCVAKTSLISQHPLTTGWADVLKVVLAKTPPLNVLEVANQMLTTTLIKNLANMDHSTKRNTLENICNVLGRQGNGVREKGTFVVLSFTLLQSLESMSESQHLHTAQSVYKLLEPLLLQLHTIKTGQVYDEAVDMCMPVCVRLGQFLQKITSGHKAEREHNLLLLSLLRLFISALKCPNSTFKGESWWNPEKMDTNSCCYLRLLCHLFDVVISGASQGPLAQCFRSLLQPILQVHLNEPLILFKFLSLLWGYNSNLGDQLDCRVSAILQTQALYVGKALLGTQPIKTLNVLASGASPVVPSLLVCLQSSISEVRRAAVAVLQTFMGVTASPYHPLVEKLFKSSDELIADPSYLSQALSMLYEEAILIKGKNKKMVSIDQLLTALQLPCCPSYTSKTLLRAIQDIDGEHVLRVLLPALERLLELCSSDTCTFLPDEALVLQLLLAKFNEKSAPLLAKEPLCLEIFIRAIGTPAKPYPTLPSFQILALEKITKSFFTALEDEKIQQKILAVLFDLLVNNKNPICAQTINSVFKAIAVDSELVANELMPADKQKVTVTVQQARRNKIQKKTQDTSTAVQDVSVVSWPKVTLILELLQHKKKLKRAQYLVPALFNLLARSLESTAAEQENIEYTKQLILSCLLNVCQKLSPDGGPISKDVLEEDKFNVELVVQCVRMSDVPQTHHHALLLLGTLAGIFPEKVLHNIMPIFTFMGANIMRLDDTYSFQVINKTVQAVIPALIKAHEDGSAQSDRQIEIVVTRIIHVFVDAMPHVPEHRRLPILSQLLGTLGPSRFLWVLILLLFKQHITQTSVSAVGAEKESIVESDQDFWISVCCEFEVKEQLTSVIKVLQFLMSLPQDSDEAPEKKRTRGRSVVKKEETMSDLIFSVDSHSGKDLRHFKFLSISFMAQLLASDMFVGKVADCEDITEAGLQNLQQNLLEEVLRYIHSVARCVEENADKPTAKFWRALLNKSYDTLDKVNALLPMDTFITVMRGLMGNHLASVRRKAMELLNNKLQQRTQWQEEQVTVLLELIGDLLNIVGRGHGRVTAQVEEEEQAINRQTALYSLKLLCRSFGSAHQEPFVPVLNKAVELVANKDEEKNVMGSALLCVAEVTSTLKALAIPQLHRLMPAVLSTLKDRKDLMTNEIYLLSAVTALQRVSETLSHFISPYLQDTIEQVTRLTLIAERLTSCPQLPVRLTSLSNTIATKVPSRVLIPTITKCYCNLVDTQQNRLGPLMNILKEHIAHMEKEQLNSHQSELTSFFLSALDFRTQHCQGDLKKTGEIEGSVINCLLVMIMKLSEVTFRPLFFKLFDWSKMNGASKDRLLTFYRLADLIANKLKGLFVLFAGQLVKPVSELLHQLNAAHTDEAFFDSDDDDSDEDDDDDDDVNVKKSSLLLQYVLDCLHKIFLYDTQRFLSKERADALLSPLVDQMENMLGGEEVYQTRITNNLVPCIGQFAVAMGDDSQWKVLNYQILLKTRHSSPKVRFSALVMLLELASKLRENYVVLLPETIPFLAELMEDECEEVEHQVQKVIQEMETVLGEPLQSYF